MSAAHDHPAFVPFTRAHFPLLHDSIGSRADLIQWAGPSFSWPLTDEQLSTYLADADPARNVTLTGLGTDGEAVAHGQLLVNTEFAVGHIARVLVHPAARGQGYGAAIVAELVRIGFEQRELHRIALNVFDHNAAAIACYSRLGFQLEGHLRDTTRVDDDHWSTYVMALLADDPRS